MVTSDMKTFPNMKNEGWLHTQKNIIDCGKTLCNERVVERYLEPCQTHQR